MKKILLMTLALAAMAGVGMADSLNIYTVGNYSLPSYECYDCAITNNYAYIANNDSGLRVINIIDKSNPVEVGSWNPIGIKIYGIAIEGNYAYVAAYDSGLTILNISNPTNPVKVSNINTPGTALKVKIYNGYAYVVCQTGGLRIIDISDTLNPIEVGAPSTTVQPNDVFIVDTLAYVADMNYGLRIISVADGANPYEIGNYLTSFPGRTETVFVSGSYAYISDGDTLRIIDVSTPSAPTLAGSYITAGSSIHGIYVNKNLVYLANNEYSLRVLDITSISTPTEVGYYGVTSSYSKRVVVDGGYIHLVSSTSIPTQRFMILRGYNGLGVYKPSLISPSNNFTFNISTPSFLWNSVDTATSYRLQISPFTNFSSLTYNQTTTDTFITSSALPDNWYYWRVKAYSATDSSEWSEVRQFSVATTTVGIPTLIFPPADTVTNDSFPNFDWSDVAGATQYQLQVARGTRWLYAADYYNGIYTFNASDSSAVTQASRAGLGYVQRLLVEGKYLYANYNNSTVYIYDISDPYNLAPVSNFAISHYSVAVKDTFLFVASSSYGLRVMNIANPALPMAVASCDSPSSVHDVKVRGSHAYMLSGGYLKVVDISNPLNPVITGTVPEANGVVLDVDSVHAYVASNSYGLQVVDISNPAAPVNQGSVDPSGSCRRVKVSGQYAYVAGDGGMRVISVANPSNPVVFGTYIGSSDFSDIDLVGHDAYLADNSSTVSIVSVADPYNPVLKGYANTSNFNYAVAAKDTFMAITNDSVVTASDCAADSFDGDGRYYWRVRAGAGSWGSYSEARRLIMDTQPPWVPTLQTPADQALINTPSPYFLYSTAGGYRYRFQVASDTGFAVVEADTIAPAPGCTLKTVLGDGHHYWRGKAMDLAENWSDWSGRYMFRLDSKAPEAPGGITANGASPSPWTKTNSFSISFIPPFDSSGIYRYFYKKGSAPSSNYDTTYYGMAWNPPISETAVGAGITPFYVWARDTAGNLDYRNAAKVDMRYDSIPPQGAAAHSNEFSRTASFTVSWNAGSDQGGSGLNNHYWIKLKTNSGAWTDLNTYYTGTSYVHSGVQGSKYYFEVAALDSAGNNEVFSGAAECSTLVDNTITSPILVLPYNGDIQDTSATVFLWQKAMAQTGSRLQCSYDSSFSTLVKDTLLAADSTGTLTLGDSLYYWRVRGENSGTDTSGWSPARTLRIDTQAPAAPALATPGNDSLTNDNTPQFSWSAVAGAVSYQLTISPDSLFGGLAVDETIDTTTYTIQTILPDSAYHWKVRAGDAAGNWSPYSARRKFTVDTKAPAVPVLVTPSDIANLSTNMPRFTWNSSSQAIRYQLQVANNTSFAPLETDTALADTSAVPVWGVNDGTHYWRVRCRDLAGNWSAYSNYRTLNISGILQVALITPDTAQVWQPGQSIWIQFTKPLYTGYIDTIHVKVRGKHTSIIRQSLTWQAASRTLLISPDSTFAANDTITVFLHGTLRDSANVSTLDGNNNGTAAGDSSDSYQMTFYTSYFGDYDGNRLVNAADLGMFAWAWYQPAYYRMFEAGPLGGTWPHQRVYVGGATRIDFEDLSGFIYSWNRADNPKSAKSGGYQDGPVSLGAVPGEKLKLAARISPEISFASMDAEIGFDQSLLTVKALEASDLWQGGDKPQLFFSKQREGRTVISAAKWQEGRELSGDLFSMTFEGSQASQTPVTLSYRLYDAQGAEICSGNTALTLNAGPGIPAGFFLGRAAPNPSNRPVAISYQLPKQARVRLEVYNIAGQHISTLVDAVQEAGYYSRSWNLKDRSQQRVANGIYFYKLTAGEYQNVGKMVLIR